MENGLSTKAMLVSLSISSWVARKFDRKVSDEVAANHNATDKAGRYNKNLLPIDAPSYKAVHQALGQAKSFHYEQTLPWTDEGCRILTAQNYFVYSDTMRKHRYAFEQAVKVFISEFPQLHDTAKTVSGSLYREEDYPKAADLPNKFGFHLKVLPLPDATDFRVSLGDDDVEEIRARIERDTHAAVVDAVHDLYQRLHKGVCHMVERLNGKGKHGKDATFKDSLVENLQELCALIPRLNLTNDERLETIRHEIELTLSDQDPEELRKDKTKRRKVAKQAAKIEADLSAFMERR